MRDHHERLKLMSNNSWAKNQSDDIQGRNVPSEYELDALLQSFGVEEDSLKEDEVSVKKDDEVWD